MAIIDGHIRCGKCSVFKRMRSAIAYLERAQQQPPMRAALSMRINLLGAN